MNDLSKWGILTDFRYSYFTMMPAYEANVIERFADLMDKRMVSRGSRPVFWSVEQQRIMGEDDFVPVTELRDSIVAKLSIKSFGSKGEKIKENYPDAKVLVFTEDAWQLCAAQAVAINDKVSYALVKHDNEYLILAEKRIGEFISRMSESTQ